MIEAPLDGLRFLLEPNLAFQPYVLQLPTIAKAEYPIKSYGVKCSCVQAVQGWRQDFPRPIGYPNLFKPQTQVPEVGAVILTNEGRYGHAGQVIDFDATTVTIRECNYNPCSCGERVLQRDNPVIRGYWIGLSTFLAMKIGA